MADEADSGAFPDRDEVVAALEGGFDNYEAPEEPSYEEANDHAEVAEQDEQTPDLGETPDLSDLDPASRALVEARIRDFQRGFTEKTTKLSDANRILQAAGGDPEAVLEAYQFQQQLLDDGPDGDAARERLYQALSAQYAQKAEPETQEVPETEDPFSDYDLPPEIRDRLNMVQQLDARLREFEQGAEQYAEQQAAEEYRQEVLADLDGKWQEIKGEYPDLEGDTPQEALEIEEEVMAFGAFTGGNLMKAVDLYHRHEARLLARLTAGSVSVPGGSVSPPAGGGHSTEPVEYTDFKTAGEGAKEFLEQAFQNQG